MIKKKHLFVKRYVVSQNDEKVAQSEDVRAHVSFNPLIRHCPDEDSPFSSVAVAAVNFQDGDMSTLKRIRIEEPDERDFSHRRS